MEKQQQSTKQILQDAISNKLKTQSAFTLMRPSIEALCGQVGTDPEKFMELQEVLIGLQSKFMATNQESTAISAPDTTSISAKNTAAETIHLRGPELGTSGTKRKSVYGA